MRKVVAVLMAALLSACAGAYVAVDGGAHTATVRTGADEPR